MKNYKMEHENKRQKVWKIVFFRMFFALDGHQRSPEYSTLFDKAIRCANTALKNFDEHFPVPVEEKEKELDVGSFYKENEIEVAEAGGAFSKHGEHLHYRCNQCDRRWIELKKHEHNYKECSTCGSSVIISSYVQQKSDRSYTCVCNATLPQERMENNGKKSQTEETQSDQENH